MHSFRASISERPDEVSFKDTTVPIWLDIHSIDTKRYKKAFSANASLRFPETKQMQENPKPFNSHIEIPTRDRKSTAETRKSYDSEVLSPILERKSVEMSLIVKDMSVFNRTEGYVKIIWTLCKSTKQVKREIIQTIKDIYRKDLVTRTILCYTEKIYKEKLKHFFRRIKEMKKKGFIVRRDIKSNKVIQTSIEEKYGKKGSRRHHKKQNIEDYSSEDQVCLKSSHLGSRIVKESDFSISRSRSPLEHIDKRNQDPSNFFSSLEDTDPILIQDYVDHSSEHTARTLQQYMDQKTDRIHNLDNHDVVESMYYKRKTNLETPSRSFNKDHSSSLRKLDTKNYLVPPGMTQCTIQLSYETLDKTERLDSKKSSANSSFVKSLPQSHSQSCLKPPLHITSKMVNPKDPDLQRSRTPSRPSSANNSDLESLIISSSNISDTERARRSSRESKKSNKSPYKEQIFKEDILAQTIHYGSRNSDSECDQVRQVHRSYVEKTDKRIKRRHSSISKGHKGVKLLFHYLNRRLVKRYFNKYKKLSIRAFVSNLLEKATKKLSNTFNKKLSLSFKMITKHATLVQRIREKLTVQANKYLYKKFNQWKFQTMQKRYEEKYKQQAFNSESHIYTLRTQNSLKILVESLEKRVSSFMYSAISTLKECYQKEKSNQVSLTFLFKTVNSVIKSTNNRKMIDSFQFLAKLASDKKKMMAKLEGFAKHIHKDINYRMQACFIHWQSKIKQKNYDSLKTIAHVQIMETLISAQMKSALSCMQMAFRKAKQQDSDKLKKVGRFVKAISGYQTNERQKVWIIWKCFIKVSKYKLSYVSVGLRHLTSIASGVKKRHFESFFEGIQTYLSPKRRSRRGSTFNTIKNFRTGLSSIENFFKSKNIGNSAVLNAFQVLKHDCNLFKIQKKALNRVLRTQRISRKMFLRGVLMKWQVYLIK